MKSQHGFTIIEVLIYLTLFTIIFGGVLASVFYMVEGVDRTQALVAIQQEGGFLLGKINWALSGVEAVNQPILGSSGDALEVEKWDSTVVNFTFDSAESELEVSGMPLNSDRFKVSNVDFIHEGALDGPENIKASFTLTTNSDRGHTYSQSFETERFLRK